MNAVDALLFRLGPHHLAVELRAVSSVLTADESHGMTHLDPRSFFNPQGFTEPIHNLRLGLLASDGPPTALILGEVLGTRTLRRRDLLLLPAWLGLKLPPILRPACFQINQKVVWLLDLDTLTQSSGL